MMGVLFTTVIMGGKYVFESVYEILDSTIP